MSEKRKTPEHILNLLLKEDLVLEWPPGNRAVQSLIDAGLAQAGEPYPEHVGGGRTATVRRVWITRAARAALTKGETDA